MPYDLLHTLSGGLIKNLCYYIVCIVDSMSKFKQGNGIQYRDVKGELDARFRAFPHVSVGPHIPQVYWTKSGVATLVAGDSNSKKGRSSHAMGKIPSSHFIMMLLQMYFVLGEEGELIPNDRNFTYSRKADQGKAKVDIQCGNITKTVLSAIVAVLILFFECKKGKHTDASLEVLKTLVETVQVIKL